MTKQPKPLPQQARLERVVKKVQAKLGTAFTFYYVRLSEDSAFLRISRTERGPQDPTAFLLYYSEENLKNRKDSDLIRDVFHELLHAIQWPLDDIFEKALSHIKDKNIRKELKQLFHDNTEAVTYLIERNFGKHIFPSCNWTEE